MEVINGVIEFLNEGISATGGLPCWIIGFGEPEMPKELIEEDMEI